MSSIYPHKEHGLNPAIFKCYLCGEDAGIILPGAKVQKFKEAGLADDTGKMNMSIGAIDYEPCDKCKEIMEQGVIFISTRDNDKDYRTGGWCAIRDEGVKRLGITPPEMLDDILQRRACFIADSAYDGFGFPRNEEINNMEEAHE